MAIAIIVAGGSGRRMGGPTAKQYRKIGDRCVLQITLSRFVDCSAIERICLVVPATDVARCRQDILDPLHITVPVQCVEGGTTRQESVYNGLCACGDVHGDTVVVVHDGVRPMVTPQLIHECVASAASNGASISAIPVFETLKTADADRRITDTVDRSRFWLAQTPQAFLKRVLLDAHEIARSEGITGTDDASLVERAGTPVHLVMGRRSNIKITTQEDLDMVRKLSFPDA